MKIAVRSGDPKSAAKLEESLRYVPRFYRTTAETSATTERQVFVEHSLGKVPTEVIFTQVAKNVEPYVTDADRALWTDTHIVFRAVATSTKVGLTIYVLD